MRLYTLIPSAVLFAALAVTGMLKMTTAVSGSLIKATGPAVYYVGADNKRYVFPNDKIYFSWYKDFTAVVNVSDAELANYTIGGNVTYRPGVRLVKIQSDPKVYAVSGGGILRWLKTESAAIALFGADWSKNVDDLSDSFFVNYKIGADVAVATDYNLLTEQQSDQDINTDKGLTAAVPPVNTNTNTNTNTPVSDNTSSACAPACGLGSACVANACKVVPGPSPMTVKAFVIDYLDTCFVGDACTNGSCCSIAGTQFADNANLKAVRPADKYLYADKQQLCGRATVSSQDRNRIENALINFASAAGPATQNKMSVSVSQTRLSGQFTMSRLPSTCSWWLAPSDLRDRLATQIDSTADSVFVVSARSFDFGTVTEPDVQTVDQSAGLSGTGYSYFVKEWETDTSGAPNPAAYSQAFVDQMNSSVDLGITNPASGFVGNHCRDAKRDFDETGLDCGGSGCTPCLY